MVTEDDVRRIALSLPQATYRSDDFAFLVGGKSFAHSYYERVEPKKPRVRRSDVLVVRVANLWDKDALLAMDPEKFFTTPHYDGYPSVLVRLEMIDEEELKELLTNAWRSRAPRSLVAEFDNRR
jgi:hypothetical protein